ncbi:hypothetical protein SDC9_164948 [bioreactor metagenome]|uniref:Uncharacterized protein n=1 Tax=bioreactor metagenome TaxID=1076179 RepID=A0A645G0A8_9ZZZZ
MKNADFVRWDSVSESEKTDLDNGAIPFLWNEEAISINYIKEIFYYEKNENL